MIKKIKVLSLFDGCSCGMVALERSGIGIDTYEAYEIDDYAIKISKKNYPQINHHGNVFEGDYTKYKGFDLLIGGSPCTHWSIANDNRETEASGIGYELFMQYVRALRESEIPYFLYENNKSISKEIQQSISKELGVEPIMINSSLVSAQLRERLYWTNIPNVIQPIDRNIVLNNILEDTYDNKYILSKQIEEKLVDRNQLNVWKSLKSYNKAYRVMYKDRKSVCLDTAQGGGRTPYIQLDNDGYRKLMPIECERLQTLPDNYTYGVSDSQRYKMIGNGWTIEVIAHILSFLKKELNDK